MFESFVNEGTAFLLFAKDERIRFKHDKYKALPIDVRNAEGNVPLHSCRGLSISFKFFHNVAFLSCWILVFKRSKGCNATADVSPPKKPPIKCDEFLGLVACSVMYASSQIVYLLVVPAVLFAFLLV